MNTTITLYRAEWFIPETLSVDGGLQLVGPASLEYHFIVTLTGGARTYRMSAVIRAEDYAAFLAQFVRPAIRAMPGFEHLLPGAEPAEGDFAVAWKATDVMIG